jgi:type II restriction/modification system DNA methylase subunit YeeA
MDTSKLKKFAQEARRKLLDQVGARLKVVLKDGSLARRENAVSVEALEKRIAETSEQQVIEQAAYTWFNRFCALRFMDVNRYTPVGTVSPADGFLQPEILTEAKQGVIDENWKVDRKAVLGLLDGTKPSSDPQQEAYRLLLVGVCNHYNSLMPFLFEEIADYTELLMPDDLLSDNSVLTDTRQAMYLENCSPEHSEQSVEVIGWLYQFYISEKKDDVFAALKKGKKISPENIPAATQLFTPHWIVRYLVENSLGRLWMLNHLDSKLVERMDYYIKPEEPETDFLRISSPEEIRVCDPACGSGHMLTYAFDLLYSIYEEQGYQATEIPTLILTHNLFGIEIDQRAGALAAFALTMKAREKDRRFFTRGRSTSGDSLATHSSAPGTQPNICVLENIHIDPDDLSAYMDKVGRNLFSGGLQGVVNQWEEADNFGSLIRPLATNVRDVLELLRERQMGEDLFLAGVHQKVLKALRQADYLSPKYHVVVANPPFMGQRNQVSHIQDFLVDNYKGFEKNLFSAFIIRAQSLVVPKGLIAKATPFVWLTISTYEELRREILRKSTIVSLVKPSYTAFFEVATVQFVAFILSNSKFEFSAKYFDLGYLGSAEDQPIRLKALIKSPTPDAVFERRPCDFEQIPGCPIAFAISETVRNAFVKGNPLGEMVPIKQGLATGKNDAFVRCWHEVSADRFGVGIASAEDAIDSHKRWFPYNKGGSFRKWYGNRDHVVNWENDGFEIRNFTDSNGKQRSAVRNPDFYFRPSITWSLISSYEFGARICEAGFVFDVGGSSAFPPERDINIVTGLLCSKLATLFLQALNPTANMQVGNISSIPYLREEIESLRSEIESSVATAIDSARTDWDSFETSWKFQSNPLLSGEPSSTVSESWVSLYRHCLQRVSELASAEESVNRAFISAYGLDNELDPTVARKEITLETNPASRYGTNKSDSELEALLLADTMREFISYAVGCMFGRYSLDKPGLILANQGETVADYRRIIAEKRAASGETREDLSFEPDLDNVIPILDGDWFPDDITERFKRFLKVTFGEEHFEENLRFLEDDIYPDNADAKTRKTVRDYFLKDFYGQHVKMYKKRPIYWLFSSPKGTFNALIYMHRYRPDTVGVVLKYLRDFQTKLQAHKQHLQSIADSADAKKADKTKALKEITQLTKDLKELEDYERKVIYPLASERREIDLDDGVKHNYPLFGEALKKIPGLDAKEDE